MSVPDTKNLGLPILQKVRSILSSLKQHGMSTHLALVASYTPLSVSTATQSSLPVPLPLSGSVSSDNIKVVYYLQVTAWVDPGFGLNIFIVSNNKHKLYNLENGYEFALM